MRFVPVPLFLLLTLAALTGCGGSTPGDASDVARTYTVRAQVVTLPADNNGELRVAHEAIDDFVAANGEVVGMDAMTMSFPLAADVEIGGLASGDVVAFDLLVDWAAEPLARIIGLERLPPGTDLVFGAARPPT